MLETLHNLLNGEFRNTVEAVHDIPSFNLLLRRERARADRQNTCLALIVFDLEQQNGNTESLVSKACARIRVTDSAGWVTKTLFGILLPGTDAAGARTLLGDLKTKLSRRADCPSGRIYLYPSNLNTESCAANMEGGSLGARV